jgi:serine/threonine-protein kinase
VVLYEMLTGTTPFNGDNLSAIMYQVLNAAPAPPSVVNPRVPPAFDRLVRRALAKRPEDRYPNARAFARDLKQLGGAPAEPSHRPPARARPATAAQADGAAFDEPTTVLLQPGRGRDRPLDAPAARPQAKQPRAGRRRAWSLALVLAIAAGLAVVAWDPAREDAALAPPPVAAPAPAAVAPAPAQPVTPGKPPGGKSPPETAVMRDVVPAEAAESVQPAARPARPPPAALAESEPAPAKATLVVAVAPWGEVYVDGRRAGVSPPLAVLELEAGRHEVEIRNQAFAPHREAVNLKAGQTLRLRHKFK